MLMGESCLRLEERKHALADESEGEFRKCLSDFISG